MAIHTFTGRRAKVVAKPLGDAPTTGGRYDDGTIVGWVQFSGKVSKATGKYAEIDSDVAKSHTRGLTSVSGTIEKAWGIESDQIWEWFDKDYEYDLEVEPDSQTAGMKLTLKNCVLTDVDIKGVEKGGSDALILSCPFEGLDWTSEEVS